jgi:WD40 repeat protein
MGRNAIKMFKPDGQIDLDHRAYFIRGTLPRSVAIAAGQDGQFSILSPDLKEVQLRRFPSECRAVSLHPSDRRLAWVDGKTGSLSVHDFGGSRLVEIAPPLIQGPIPEWMQRGFDDCSFSEDGRYLWTVSPLNREDVLVQLHDAESGATVATDTLKDPFRGSYRTFQQTGRPGLMALWLAAGQDGQQVYWLKRTGSRFSCIPEHQLRNTIPPVFSPEGDELLVVNEDRAICKFDFPAMHQAGVPVVSSDDDDQFAEWLCYLNDRQALVGTQGQRIILVDAVDMKVEAEVYLEGHEARPFSGTDISEFLRLGDVIIFVYRRDHGTEFAGWKDSLLWLKVS